MLGIQIATMWMMMSAQAQTQAPERAVLQARRYRLGHELAFALGALPRDPFEKGWSLGFSYTVHASDLFSWELVNASAAHLTPTALRENLIRSFERSPRDFAAPRAMITTGFVITPIYGKMVFLDDLVIHQAVFAGVHAGVIFGSRATVLETARDFRPSVGLGIGYRLFLTDTLSVRLDARDFLSFRPELDSGDARFEQVIVISTAIALSSKGDEP